MKNKIDWKFVFDEAGEVLFKIGFFALVLVFVVYILLLAGIIPL